MKHTSLINELKKKQVQLGKLRDQLRQVHSELEDLADNAGNGCNDIDDVLGAMDHLVDTLSEKV